MSGNGNTHVFESIESFDSGVFSGSYSVDESIYGEPGEYTVTIAGSDDKGSRTSHVIKLRHDSAGSNYRISHSREELHVCLRDFLQSVGRPWHRFVLVFDRWRREDVQKDNVLRMAIFRYLI